MMDIWKAIRQFLVEYTLNALFALASLTFAVALFLPSPYSYIGYGVAAILMILFILLAKRS